MIFDPRIGRHTSGLQSFSRRLLASAASVALILGQVAAANANPVGGTVSSGNATISTPASGTLQIDQTTKIVIINWNSFNIAGGETTKFVQPNASSIAVNRIGGSDPSTILGSLLANGKVVLINGNGILFGPGSKINVGSLLATTSDASDADIASGKAKFDKAGNPNAQIINQGNITAASGGMIGLIAPAVSNSGTITAKLGSVTLGASNVFTVDFTGDGLVSFPVDGNVVAAAIGKNGKPVEALIVNDGKISGGTVVLSARAAANLVTNVISMKGEIAATAAHDAGGKIVLDGGQSGDIAVAGSLDASGASGGSISVVSQGTTIVSGTLKAEGSQGNGGFIETSGTHLHVADSAKISTQSVGGLTGTWLIDPNDFTIAASGGDITGSTLSTNLATSDVTIHSGDRATAGSGDIYVNDPVSWTSAHTLTVDAYHSIYIGAPITVGGASGGLTLTTNDGGSGGDFQFSSGANVTFSHTSAALNINGTSYTLIDSESALVGINSTLDTNNNMSGNYALANDLTLTTTYTDSVVAPGSYTGANSSSGDASFNGTPFIGTFEGLGHTVSNLTIHATGGSTLGESIGLFGIVGYADLGSGSYQGGVVRDVSLVNANITATAGGQEVGTLIGTLAGGAYNGNNNSANVWAIGDSASGTISVDQADVVGGLVGFVYEPGNVTYSSASVDISGSIGGAAGGLIGYERADPHNDATFNGGPLDTSVFANDYATGDVTVTATHQVFVGGFIGLTAFSTVTHSFATGNVDASGATKALTGGFVGSDGGTGIDNSFELGDVKGGAAGYTGGFGGTTYNVSAVYSAGKVTGVAGSTGGLSGHSYGGSQNGYWDITTSGQNTSAGGTGLTDTLMKSGDASNFSGQGMTPPIWGFTSGKYPYLAWYGPVSHVPKVSGTVYSDYGVTPLGNATVVEAFLSGGAVIATGTSNASTGAYSVDAPGSNGTLLLFLDNSNGKFADTVVDYSGSKLKNVNLYAGYLNFINTSAVSVTSVLSSLSTFAAPTGGYSTNDFLFGVSGSNVTLATGAGLAVSSTGAFTVDQALTFTGGNGLAVKTGAGDITISNPVNLANGTLTLDSYQSIMVNNPITISGSTGAAALTTNDGGTGGNLYLDNGISITYSAASGGSLEINGVDYTLERDLASLQTALATGTGHYAIANDIDSAGAWTPADFNGTFEGLGHTIDGLSITTDDGSNNVGFIGSLGSSGAVRDIQLTNISVSFDGPDVTSLLPNVGGLVGKNDGMIFRASTSGSISGVQDQSLGGLVGDQEGGTISQSTSSVSVNDNVGSGFNFVAGTNLGGLVGEMFGGTISQSYATGTITDNGNSAGAPDTGGGFVGYTGGGTISDSYAWGSVTGPHASGGILGGFVGQDDHGSISNSYASGTVTFDTGGYGFAGGFVGYFTTPAGGTSGCPCGTVSNVYYNSSLNQRAYDPPGASPAPTITGLSTSTLQNGSLPGGLSSSIWNATSGSYPLLNWQPIPIPAVQVSGTVYSDYGVTALGNAHVVEAFLTGGAVIATGTSNASTGAYSVAAPDSNGTLLLFLDNSSGKFADTVVSYSGSALTGVNLYAGYLNFINTSAVSVSSVLSSLSTFAAPTGGYSANDFLFNVSGSNVTLATGAGLAVNSTGAFTVDQALTFTGGNGLAVKTGAGDITISNPISLANGTLTLDSYQSIWVNAPITISGSSGAAALTTNDGGTGGDYSFDLHSNGFAGSLSFTAGSGGSLSINGTPYILLYSMADMQAINANDTALTGHYALANSLDATATSGWVPIGTNGTGGVTGGFSIGPPPHQLGFSGTFEGLGHTISNLTVNQATGGNVGPFGDSSGTIRDIGMVGGSVTGAGSSVGGLVGSNDGTVIYTYETGTVAASAIFSDLGGLVGKNGDSGTVSFSFATGAVSGLFGNIAVGGLVGASFGTLDDSYAAGAVTGANSAYEIGGLVGNNTGSSISDSYASGAVIGGSGSTQVGGLVGWNLNGTMTNTYASGAVSGSTKVGGLVGQNTSGTLSNTYWDTQTSGQGTGIGADNNSQSGNITGKTTAQLLGALPTGFGGTVWGTGSGLYTYLLWQYDGTPQAISGIAYSDAGTTTLSSATVSALVNGTSLGSATTGANGYYYILAAPGTLTGTQQVLTYLNGNTTKANTYIQSPTGNITNDDLYGGYLRMLSGAATSSEMFTGLSTALGSYTGSNFLNSGGNLVSGTTLDIEASNNTGLTIDGALNVGTGTIIVNAAGSLVQTSPGILTAATLTGSSVGNTALTANNKIASLGTFTSQHGFTLTDARSLTVSGKLTVVGCCANLKTVGSGSNLTINAAIADAGHALSLISAGTLTQTSPGILTAASLTGSSVGNAALTANNKINSLGVFTSSGSFSLTDARSLTVDGTLTVTGCCVNLKTAGSGSNLTINAAIADAGHALSLISAGTLTQTSTGILTAATLTGSSVSDTMLTANNKINNLGAFTSSGGFSLTDARSLTVNGALNVTACCAVLKTTGSGSNLAINAAITNAGHTLSLISAGTLTQTSPGFLTAASLTGSSVGNTTLTANNKIGSLGAFTSLGNFSLTDARSLTVDGALNTTTCCVNLKTVGSGSDLTINAAITNAGNTLSLISAGMLSQTSPGIITAATLTGSSVGDTALTASNKIASLGAFTSLGSFSLIDAHSLTVSGALNAAYAAINTTGSGSNLAINAAITVIGHTLRLVSAGTLTQTSAGILTAGALNGSSQGDTTLTTAANAITNLSAFTTSGTHAFALTDTQSLTVTGATTGEVTVGSATLTTTAGNISIEALLTAGTTTLISAAKVLESGSYGSGAIHATTLNVTAVTGINLSGANVITTIGTNHTTSGPDIVSH